MKTRIAHRSICIFTVLFTILTAISTARAARPGLNDKWRIMRDKTMQIHLTVDSERVVRETAAVGFNVLSLPGHKDLAGIRRRVDMCARYDIGFLQWFRGTAHYGGPKDQEETRYVWPSGHVSRLLSPNSDAYWDHMGKYILAYAKMSAEQPAMMGVFLDFEPYDKPAWGMTYPLSYDNEILQMFAAAKGIEIPTLPGKERKPWIDDNGHHEAFEKFQVAHWRKKASELRRAVDAHNPDFVFVVYPALHRSIFLREVVGQSWGTERAPLISADPGNYGERPQFIHYDDALRKRFDFLKKEAEKVHGMGFPVRYLVGLDPIGRLGDAEFFGKSGAMFSEAADGYWVFYEGPRFENKLTLKTPSGDHRDYYQWFARGNQAIIDGNYEFWRKPRHTPPTYKRKAQDPQKRQYAEYSHPYTYSVTKLMQEKGFEASHLVEHWHLDADYLANFDVVFLKNFGAAAEDKSKIRAELREHVRRGGSVLLNSSLRGFQGSPFPEIATFPSGRPPRHEGRFVIQGPHPALGGVEPGTVHKPYYPFYTSYTAGQEGEVLATDEEGRHVLIAGTFGQGRVVFAGINYPRPSEVRNHFVNVPEDPELENIEVFWHQKQPYPHGVERQVLEGVLDWLDMGRRWWEHEFDGTVHPTAADPPWEEIEAPEESGVVADATAVGGKVWQQRASDKWPGYRQVEREGNSAWTFPRKRTIEVRFRHVDGEDPAVIFFNQPLQWQALLEGAGDGLDVLYLAGRNGNRYSFDEQWNVVRFLIDDRSMSVYMLTGGALRGRSPAWTELAAAEPINPHWLGFGPDGPPFLHLGGSLDIDYVRWVDNELVKPIVRAAPAEEAEATFSCAACEPASPSRPLVWKNEVLVLNGYDPDPEFRKVVALINARRFDEAMDAIERMGEERDAALLAMAVVGHPDSIDTDRAQRFALNVLRNTPEDERDVVARRLLHELEIYMVLPGRGMISAAQLLPARDTIRAGNLEDGIRTARGDRRPKIDLFNLWSIAGMFEGEPSFSRLVEATEESLDDWANAGAAGKDRRIKTFLRLLEQVKANPWACMTIPESSVLYPKVLRSWMRGYYWWWKQIGERQRPMSKQGFEELQPKFAALFPSNEAGRIYGGERISWGDEFLPTEAMIRVAPDWAVKQQELRGRIDHIVKWWFRTRQRPDGLLEGHPEDDCEVLRRWSVTSFAAADPEILEGIRKLVDGIWNCGQLVNGYDRKMKDVEHSSEMSADTSVIMGLDYGDPMQFERFLQTTKVTDELHTGINPHGHRHFRTISMSATKVAPNDVDTNYHGRAMRPAAMVAWYSRIPRAVDLLHGWAKAWSEDTVKAGETKPAGIMPALVHFDTCAVDGQGNWTAREYGDLYMWWANNSDMIAGKMMTAAALTGDDSVLDGLRAQWGLVQRHLSRLDPNAPHGSEAWAAKELLEVSHLATWYRQATGDTQFDDVVATDTWLGGAYFVSGDPAHMAAAHEEDLQPTRYNLPMVTSEVIGMDRVDIRPWSLLPAMTGSPVDTTQPPTFAVTWRDVGSSFAALVRRFDDASISTWAYSFAEKPTHPRIRFWRLQPGRYELRVSVDADMDGKPDGRAIQRVAFEVQRRLDDAVFALPPQKVCLVEVRQTKRLPDLPAYMPDVAIHARDLTFQGTAKAGQPVVGQLVVHNIGAHDGRDIEVQIHAGRVQPRKAKSEPPVATAMIPHLAYPADLVAKTETVTFTWTPPTSGNYVVSATVTDQSGVPEIYLGNNRVLVDMTVE